MIFQKIELGWDGKSYVIPADRVMRAIAEVEGVITLHELQQFRERSTYPMARIAQAYGTVLRFAGCDVSDEEVYGGMFKSGNFRVPEAVIGLLNLMIPPMPEVASHEAPSGGNGLKVEERSSRRRTKLRRASA